MHDKDDYLFELYKMERMHHMIFSDLSKKEKNKELKLILENLSKTEEKHAQLWGKVIKIDKEPVPRHVSKLFVYAILFIRYFLGLILAVKFMEYFENQLEARLKKAERTEGLSKRERAIVRKIIADELEHEKPLKDKLLEYNSVLKNIRDIIFGMNDGLVEVLAAVSGLGAALQNPILTLLGGVIIAVSGTLSMSGGAYLSTTYEKHIRKGDSKDARLSAFYVGFAYIIGSIFPLLPFGLGFYGYYGILLAIISSSIALSVVAGIIAIISNVSIKKNIARTIIISIGSALITMLLGSYARAFLKISI
jgi:VIT1/CCC1 family predicted Fe2+/Mn2+ transporter